MRTDRRLVAGRAGLIVAALIVLAVAPYGLDNYWLRVLTTALMFGAMAQALNCLVGLAGYPSLGNVVFFGVGAYAAAILGEREILSPVLSIVAGGLVAAVYALLTARAMLGLRGSYFLMATVALNGLTLEIAVVARDLTGGTLGLRAPALLIGTPAEVYQAFYFIFLGLVAVSSIVLLALRRSKLGFGMLAIRGNEDAAEALGVPTFRYKTVAWTASALLTGWVGGVYAYWIGFVDPDAVFDLVLSLMVFLMVLIGGRWLVIGPLIGAGIIQYLDVTAWSRFSELHLGVVGLVIVLLVTFLPGGISELPAKVRLSRDWFRRRSLAARAR
jgi:branched-chain amino acid transport system permease protein